MPSTRLIYSVYRNLDLAASTQLLDQTNVVAIADLQQENKQYSIPKQSTEQWLQISAYFSNILWVN